MHESRSPSALVPVKASGGGRSTSDLHLGLGIMQPWVWFAGGLRIDRGEVLS